MSSEKKDGDDGKIKNIKKEMTRKFTVIAAMHAQTRGIGFKGGIPWNCPEDMKYFRATTMGSTVIMGSRTFDSLPSGPLKGRTNIILSSKGGEGRVKSLDAALAAAPEDKRIFVIGGGAVYEEAVAHPDCEHIYLTKIDDPKFSAVNFDTFFPLIPARFYRSGLVTPLSEIAFLHTYTQINDSK